MTMITTGAEDIDTDITADANGNADAGTNDDD
jgi:hypothetical protein